MDGNAVLCVGLVCLDIIAETENFPIEDTDQRFIYWLLNTIGIKNNDFPVVEFLICVIVVVGMLLIQVQFLLSLDWNVSSLELLLMQSS